MQCQHNTHANVNAMPMLMLCPCKATTNTIHPSIVWENYNLKINWQEEMWENCFPIFVMHLPVLWLLAAATTGTIRENQQSMAKSNLCVWKENEWMRVRMQQEPTNLQGEKTEQQNNNKKSTSPCHAHASESTTNNNQPAAAPTTYVGPMSQVLDPQPVA